MNAAAWVRVDRGPHTLPTYDAVVGGWRVRCVRIGRGWVALLGGGTVWSAEGRTRAGAAAALVAMLAARGVAS